MSILNGAVSAALVHAQTPPFGCRLRPIASVPLPGCADVTVSPDGTLAYAVCRDRLVTFALREKEPPRELGSLSGLHSCRQLAVSEDGTAFVTSRQDGLFIVDVRTPEKPVLLRHTDTLELATGVCASRGLCLAANRHMGVEIWDVSDPAQPVYCASFPAGEAQSVCMDGGLAYVGDWVNRRVWIADISDPRSPRIVSSFQIDGFADGVFVRGGLCLAAGGHHSAALKNRRKYRDYPYMTPQMLQDGFGCGHGLTLYDVSVPDAPEFLSEIKFPPLCGEVDTWRVTASGAYAYAADSHNGVFAVDISDPLHPFIAAHYPLPLTGNVKEGQPALQTARAAAVGIACAKGMLLAAGGDSGLHVLEFGSAAPAVPAAPPAAAPRRAKAERVFSCSGQVHSFVHQAGHLLLACGDDGLYALPDSGGEPAFHAATRGIAHDAVWMDGLLYAAEGDCGVSAWWFSAGDGFSCAGCWEDPDGCARQLVPLPGRGMLAVQLDVRRIGFLEADGGSLRMIRELQAGGLLYHRHLCRKPHPSGYLASMPLTGGLSWIDLDRLEPACPDWHIPEMACPFEDGAAIEGDRIWLVRNRRLGVFRDPAQAAEAVRNGALRAVEGAQLRGMPFIAGDTLILLNRVKGIAERLDIRQEVPRLLDRTVLPGQPEFAAEAAGCCWIACGHEGLFRIGPA